MAFDPSTIPDSLKVAYREKRCAMMVGAGASVGAGLPTWVGLLEEMIAVAEREVLLSPEKSAQYRTLLQRPEKFLMVAAGLKQEIGNIFDEVIERIFISSAPNPTHFHEALAALDKLPFVVTINYDTLIEQAFREKNKVFPVCTFLDAGEIQRRLSRREFFLLKAHGDASRMGNGIVLTESDYRDILYKHRGYQSMLSAMFTMNTMVFVGASMGDPELNLLLGYIADVFSPTSGPTHYALMAREDFTDVEKDRWRRDYKVQIISISKANSYSDLTEFLTALKDV